MTVDFYRQLGTLFYAFANADGDFNRLEKLKIIELTMSDWCDPSEYPEAKDAIYSTLQKLIKEEESSNNAFLTFTEYYHLDREAFSIDIKKLILNSAYAISDTYAKRNKSEIVLFSRLYLLFFPPEKS